MRRAFYRLLLRAYPRRMRAEFGVDMQRAFEALCDESAGVREVVRVYVRETVDALRNGFVVRGLGSGAGRSLSPSVGGPSSAPPSPSSRPPRSRKGNSSVQALLQDLGFAARALTRCPGFAVIAVLTLALGIGPTTVIFSVVDAVLLRPLPYADPGNLFMVGSEYGGSGRLSPLTPPDFLDFRRRNDSFSGVVASASATLDLAGEGTPRRFSAARVSADFFRILGVEPVLGRTFRTDEETPGMDHVVVITHEVWQAHWGGDPSVVGRTVTMNRTPYTIIGVMPAAFRAPEAIRYQPSVEAWVPLALDAEQVNRFSSYLWAIGRLEDGVTGEAAAAEASALTESFRQEFYDGEARFAFRLEPLRERTLGTIAGSLGVLLGAVGLLLLIACANVANLSLARGSERRREIALRTALGAGPGRIAQQLVLESMLLALGAGVVGTLLAYGGVALLPVLDPGGLPRLTEVVVDLRVLAFALGLSTLTGVVFGVGPALKVSRADVNDVIEARARCGRGGNQRARGTLVTAQTALALMLLVGSGLLINSFVRLRGVDPGFDPDRLLTMRLYIPPEVPGGSRWDPASEAEWESWRTFYGELLERIETLPGVTAAAGTTSPPIVGAEIWMAVAIEGAEPDPDAEPAYQADNRVSTGYFGAVGTELLRGREFTRADDNGPAHAIVNEAFAERYWPGEDVLGKRFQHGTEIDPEGEFMTVVGVVENSTQAALGSAPEPEFFVPFFRNPLRAMTVVARYEGAPEPLAAAMREAVWELRPDLPVPSIEPMAATIADSITQPRFYTLLLTAFASVAMLLAAVGIYGTMAYTVAQRTREVGIRLALGARGADVVRLVVGQAMRVAAIGVALGIVGALALSRFLESFVFGIEPTDPVTFAAVALLVAAVALLACYLPARRAAAHDPTAALRS